MNYVSASARSGHDGLQGYLADKITPTPQEPHRALGMVLLWGPRGMRFLFGEVPP